MRISISSDLDEGAARHLGEELRRRGHTVLTHGALRPDRTEPQDDEWAYCSAAAARDVAEGRADQAVVCCWTGTGASIAANKVPGIRAALCTDAPTAAGARRWNDANALALSLRLTTPALLTEILDAWFTAEPSHDPTDRRNIAQLEPAHSYLLMRQDDNGNRYLVARYPRQSEAEAAAEEFEARGHKQLYWVEADTPSGP